MNPYNPHELMHHGIKDMKWGRRNGPPYPLTMKDYSAAEKRAMKEHDPAYYKKKVNEMARSHETQFRSQGDDAEYSDKNKNTKQNQNGQNTSTLNESKALAYETVKATKNVAKLIDKVNKKKNTPNINTSKLTDKEMQDYIRRANLEQNYRNLKEQEYSEGRAKAADIVDTFGDVLTTAGSILSVIVLTKALAEKTNK